MTFPWRGDALEPNVHFRAVGHTGADYGNPNSNGDPRWGIDFHAAKFVNSEWETTDGGPLNTDAYIYGVNVYSPVDGEIVACWRKTPDKLTPTVDYDLDKDGIFGEGNNCVDSGDVCQTDADCAINDECGDGHDVSPMSAGNHLQIRNEDGDYIIFFAHMQYNSIPTELCPLPANRDDRDKTSEFGEDSPGADGWPDDLLEDCNGAEGFPRDTILPAPVPIKAGQFLGRVGHSGSSTRPHLHMHAKPLWEDDQDDLCVGNSEEIEFYESWSQMCAEGAALSGGWTPLDGYNPLRPYDLGGACTDDGDCVGDEVCQESQCVVVSPHYCFLPDAIGPQQDEEDFNVSATNLHFATHADGDVLVYQTSGALRLRSYDIDGFGHVQSQDTQNEGTVKDVAVARPNSTRNVIVSIRGNDDNLKHIPYTVSSVNGTIVRQVGKELTESDVYQVESTYSPAHAGYVVAIEDDDHNLKVIDYHVNNSLDITRNVTGSGTGGTIVDVAIATMEGYDGVVTAEVTDLGYLTVRSFDVPAAGGVTNADVWSSWVDATSVTIDRVPTSVGEYVVTSVIRDGGELRLDSWEVDGSGNITWMDTYETGDVSEHDGTAGPKITGDFVMGVRDSDDEFKLIGWDVNWLGQIRRNSTRDLTAVTQTAVASTAAGGGNYLVAARTDTLNELHLFVYDENYHMWY